MKTQFDDDVVGARASPVDATPTQSFESSPTDSWAQRDTTFQASTCVSQSEERVDLARRAHEKGNMGGGGTTQSSRTARLGGSAALGHVRCGLWGGEGLILALPALSSRLPGIGGGGEEHTHVLAGKH